MISVYLCEDDKRQLEQYSRLIRRFLDFEGYEEIPVYNFQEPHALLNAVRKNGGTGLYFLDIQLNSDIDGLELARQIRLLNPLGYIIFLTTHSEMMALTFQYHVEALDFITKDDPRLLEQRLRDCLRTAISYETTARKQQDPSVGIKTENRILYMNPDDILYIRSDSSPHKVTICSQNGIHRVTGSLKEFQARLGPRFVRCHTSFLVNMDHVSSFSAKMRQLVMDNQDVCPVALRSLPQITRLSAGKLPSSRSE